MKRLGISLFMIILIVAAGIVLFLLGRIDIDKVLEGAVPEAGVTTAIISFPFESPGELDSWQEKALAGKKTRYTLTEEDGKKCVKAESDDSASTLYYRRQFSYAKDPYVSWDWKVSKFPDRDEPESLDKKKDFDFAAQVYVVFHAKFFLNAKAIQYVWTENIPEGFVTDSPYTKNVKVFVLESGLSEEWKHENRNIKEDFKKLFKEELRTDIEGISFMTDADSTGTKAVAFFDNFEIGTLSTQVTYSQAPMNHFNAKFIELSEKYPLFEKIITKVLFFVKRSRQFLSDIGEKFFKGGR